VWNMRLISSSYCPQTLETLTIIMSEERDDDLISRTQKKIEAEAAQSLGERLLDISDKQLKSLNLEESLFDAVQTAKNIKAYGGRKRQLQYIGKLMRNVDTSAIVEFFDQLDNNNIQLNAKFRNMENWRDRLVAGGNDAIQAFLDEYPLSDAQQLRQLVRNANNKKNEKLTLKSKRAIFQFVKDVITNSA